MSNKKKLYLLLSAAALFAIPIVNTLFIEWPPMIGTFFTSLL